MTPARKQALLRGGGVSSFNAPKRTPGHPTKSHVVVAKVKKKGILAAFEGGRRKMGR